MLPEIRLQSNINDEITVRVKDPLKGEVIYKTGGEGTTGGVPALYGSGGIGTPGYGDGSGTGYGSEGYSDSSAYSGYNDGIYAEGYGYGGTEDSRLFQLSAGYDQRTGDDWDWSLLREDMEQNHHFHVYIDRLDIGRLRNFKVPLDVNKRNFLPVRSISFTETSFNHLSIPLGIFGDLPFLQKRGVGRINMSICDNDQEDVARGIRKWIQDCFPMGKYVDFPSNVVAKMEYHSYSVKGQENVPVSGTYYVIPADNYSYGRSYEDNSLKTINFGVILIGREGANL